MKKTLFSLALIALCSGSQAASVLNFSFSNDATPVITGSSLVGTLAVDYTYLETLDDNGDLLPLPSFLPDPTAPPLSLAIPPHVAMARPLPATPWMLLIRLCC